MDDSAELDEEHYGILPFGGHLIQVDDSVTRIQGVEMRHLGQKGRLARYPIHWHHRRDAPGQFLKRSSIHHCFSRSVTIHDTHRVLVEGVAAYDTLGHMFYLEDGTETLNVFRNNIGANPHAVGTGSNDYDSGAFLFDGCSDHPPGIRLQFLDHQPSVFWITNGNNTFVGNVAVGGSFSWWIR